MDAICIEDICPCAYWGVITSFLDSEGFAKIATLRSEKIARFWQNLEIITKKLETMREIKFRGKRLDNGEWESGDLLENQGRNFIYHATSESTIEDNDDGRIVVVAVEVDPATIGQYTELKDKNGSDIWEGDIVMAESRDEEYDNLLVGLPFLIMFSYGEFCIAEDEESPWGSISNLDILEVIGNIHDNPELLKGGE